VIGYLAAEAKQEMVIFQMVKRHLIKNTFAQFHIVRITSPNTLFLPL
jgi:hypothetical protein